MVDGTRCGSGFGDDGEFQDEARTHRLVLFDANGTVVVLDDTAHNGEAQPGAALFGGEVGKE